MARAEIPYVVRRAAGAAVANSGTYVYSRGTTSQVSVYAAASGGSPLTQPLTADSEGRINGYVDVPVQVDLVTTTPDGYSYTQEWEALGAAAGSAPLYSGFLTPVTSLPGSPTDGQMCVFQADATNGVYWMLRYRSGSASAYKWEFVGGPPLFSEVTTAETRANTAYGALTTAGPAITLPLAGDYDVEYGARIHNDTVGDYGKISYDIGATGAVDADMITARAAVASNPSDHHWRKRRKTGLTAVALTMKYATITGGTAQFSDRTMYALPIRVG